MRCTTWGSHRAHPCTDWLYPPTMSGQLTCGNCGYSWWSNAGSARTRCGACRSVVYVPAHVRHDGNTGVGDNARITASLDGWSNTDGVRTPPEPQPRRHWARGSCRHHRWGRLAPTSSGLTSTEPDGTTPLAHLGAVTRWSCGHRPHPFPTAGSRCAGCLLAACPRLRQCGHRRPV